MRRVQQRNKRDLRSEAIPPRAIPSCVSRFFSARLPTSPARRGEPQHARNSRRVELKRARRKRSGLLRDRVAGTSYPPNSREQLIAYYFTVATSIKINIVRLGTSNCTTVKLRVVQSRHAIQANYILFVSR